MAPETQERRGDAPFRARSRATVGVAVLAALLALGGCGRGSVPDARLAQIRAVYDELMIASEPLCIEAGPFPVGTGASKGTCDRCQDLAQAGLLSQRIVDDASGGYVEYALTAAGREVYRIDPDPQYLAVLLARFAKQGEPDRRPDIDAIANPRMCFGQTRFHSLTGALSPITVGGSRYLSVKIVAEATDTSNRLFDPRIARLGLPIPPHPEPGRPSLYPESVITFQVFPQDGSLEVTDMRYGAWVNEP
jgi:hypothetical protein